MTKPQLLAFLLPQFHRIPENDRWWGEGFTEWTNVRKARSSFRGHRQPRVPLDGRYYDLLDSDTQDWQAELAKAHGLGGFCYYHYWFAGRQLLQRPVDSILRRRAPDFPFCLAWANEPWTRTWDGGDRDVLMPQAYGGKGDWEAHFRYLEKAFRDPRYIRVDDCPVLLIYRTASIAECEDMLDCWRNLAVQSGFAGLHVVSMLTVFGRDARSHLFDAYVEFEPFYTLAHLPVRLRIHEKLANGANRLCWKYLGRGPYAPRSRDYRSMWREIANRPLPSGHYPGAFVDWDNSPRRRLDTSLVMRNVDLSAFRTGLSDLYEKAGRNDTRFIFINAWNEWAEGTYLEPDEDLGTAYLDAIKSVVGREGGA
ncbi:glycoside hydrolase family 99-like domain-containing protein [Variovorax sp. MHTC-1]|uniref:glycosyltransferase WbsX family protein n=1 Tax=Variovorax sp. MHTC-1 TaxID=2495593 RepID=UPI001C8E4AAA|nr:glycoside hydrolase family 99-like domain-containing protein [Variovorax sp. MHTC-1]